MTTLSVLPSNDLPSAGERPPLSSGNAPFRASRVGRLPEHDARDALQLSPHFGLALGRRRTRGWPHDHTVRTGVAVAADKVAVGRLTEDRDAEGRRCAARLARQVVERCAAHLYLLGRRPAG